MNKEGGFIKSKWFYYIRDRHGDGKPLITVCLLEDNDGTYFRGIAVCSLFEQPKKAVGRQIAEGRALKAYFHGTRSDSVITRDEAYWVFEMCGILCENNNFFEYKSEADVRLTLFEKKLVGTYTQKDDQFALFQDARKKVRELKDICDKCGNTEDFLRLKDAIAQFEEQWEV